MQILEQNCQKIDILVFNHHFSKIKPTKPPKNTFRQHYIVGTIGKVKNNNDFFAIHDKGRAVKGHILVAKSSKYWYFGI